MADPQTLNPIAEMDKLRKYTSGMMYDPATESELVLRKYAGLSYPSRPDEPIESVLEGFYGGASTEQAHERVMGALANLDETRNALTQSNLRMKEAEIKEKAVEGVEAKKEAPAARYPGSVFTVPYYGSVPISKITEKEVEAEEQKLFAEAWAQSPRLMLSHGQNTLSPRHFSIATAIASAGDRAEDVAEQYHDEVQGLSIDEYGAFMGTVSALNPELDRTFIQRFLPETFGPAMQRTKQFGGWLKTQGLDLATYYDTSSEFAVRLEREFGDEMGNVFDDEGNVKHGYKSRYDALVKDSSGLVVPRGPNVSEAMMAADKAILKQREQFYRDNGGRIYKDVLDRREKDKFIYDVEQATVPRFRDLGKLEEGALKVSGITADMVVLAGMNAMVPGSGFVYSYGAHQYEMEREMVNRHGVDPMNARVATSTLSALWAATEYAQVKALDPKYFGMLYKGAQNNPEMLLHYLGKFAKRKALHAGLETGEEYMQAAIDFGMKEWFRTVHEAEGMTFDENAEAFINEVTEATKYMPVVTLLGGGTINGARAMATKDWQAMVAPEFRQAWQDKGKMKLMPEQNWFAVAKMRKTAAEIENGAFTTKELDAVPSRVLEVVEQAETDKQAAEQLQKLGYKDTESTITKARYKLDLLESVNAAARAEVEQIDAVAKTEMGEVDESGFADSPKMSLVQTAVERFGEGLGIEPKIYATAKEAIAAHPELKDAGDALEASILADGKTVVLVEENVSDAMGALRKFAHEAFGHKGLDLNPKRAEFIKDLQKDLNADAMRELLPDFYRNQSDEAVAEEYLVRLVEQAVRGDFKTEQDKSAWQKFTGWMADTFKLDDEATQSGRRMAAIAKDVLQYSQSVGSASKSADSLEKTDADASLQAGDARYSVAPPTDSEAFKKWFGDSKVVDEQGDPMVVYHGTASKITEFSKDELGRTTDAKSAKEGFFFSENPYDSGSYVLSSLFNIDGYSDLSIHDILLGQQGKESDAFKKFQEFEDRYGSVIFEAKEEADAMLPRSLLRDITPGAFDASLIDPRIVAEAINGRLPIPLRISTRGNDLFLGEIPVGRVFESGGGFVFDSFINRTFPRASSDYNALRDGLAGYLVAEKLGTPVMAVYLSAQNPKVLNHRKRKINIGVSAKRKAGTDSTQFRGIKDPLPSNHWIVYDPTQIKSAAGNVGTFDPQNPDIRYSVAQQTNPGRETAAMYAKKIFMGEKVDVEQVAETLKRAGVKDADPERVLENAKTIASMVIAKRDELQNDPAINREIRNEEIRHYYKRQVADVQRSAVEGGELWGRMKERLDVRIKKQAEAEMQRIKGLSPDELEKYAVEVIDLLKQLEVAEKTRAPKVEKPEEELKPGEVAEEPEEAPAPKAIDYTEEVEDFLYRIKQAAVRSAVEEGLIENKGMEKGLKSAAVRQRYARTVQNLLRKAVNELAYGKVRQDLSNAVDRLGDMKQLNTIDSHAADIVNRAFNQRAREDRQALIDDMWDMSAQFKGRIAALKEQDKRPVAARFERYVKMVRRIMAMSFPETAEKVGADAAGLEDLESAIRDRIHAIEHLSAPEGKDDVEWRSQLRDELDALYRFGNLKFKTLAQVADAHDFLKNRIEEELEKQEARVLEHKKAIERKKADIHDVLPLDKRPSQRKTKAQIMRDWNSRALPLQYRLDEVALYGEGKAGETADALMQDYSFRVNQATFAAGNEIARTTQDFADAVESIYGRDPDTVLRELMDPRDDFRKYSFENVDLSKSQLMQILATIQQEQYGESMPRRKAMEVDIINEMTPEDLELIDWFRQYYSAAREELSDVNERVTGLPVESPDPLYMPISIETERGGLAETMLTVPVVPKALSPRVRHQKDLREDLDVISIFQMRLRDNAQFKNFAELGIELRDVFGDFYVQKAIDRVHGEDFRKQLVNHISDILIGKTIKPKDNLLDKVVNWQAYTSLGFNLRMFLRQPTSFPAFGYNMPLGDVMRYLADSFSPEGMAAMKEILASDHAFTRQRVGMTQVLNDILQREGDNGFIKFMKNQGMFFNRMGDMIPILRVGQGYYRGMVEDAARQGMDEEAAKKWAMDKLFQVTHLSQQSGEMMNMSEWQRRGGSPGRALGQFTSTPQQYWAKQLREFRRMRAKKDHEFTKTMILNHLILPLFYNGMNMIMDTLLGDEQDKRDWLDLLVSMFIGPMSGIYIAGTILESSVKAAATGKFQFGGSFVPASGIVDDAQTLMLLSRAMVTLDGEDVMKQANKLLRSVAAPYREVSKAVENINE